MEIPNEMKNITTTIMSSIIYGYFWEMINPGTFQENVDKMYEENGLCKVRFPKHINIEKFKSLYKDIMKTTPTDPPATTHKEKESEPERNQEEERIVQPIYIYKVVAFVCVCVCVYNSPTAHTTGPIMTKPGMMMVPHLRMVHTIFQGQGQRSRS